MLRKILLLLSLLWIAIEARPLESKMTSNAKVLIITHSYNRPDFIEIQDKTFNKFLKDDYEFVVFIDAAEKTPVANKIHDTCQRLGLRSLYIPQSIHTKPYLFRLPYEDKNHSAPRCANVVQYSLDQIGFDHEGIVVIIDSDMFLIDDFSIEKYLDGYDIAAVTQLRGQVEYLWNGLVFFNMQTLPDVREINFNCGVVEGQKVDVGGYTYYYLKSHPEIKKRSIDSIHVSQIPCLNSDLKKNLSEFIRKKPPNVEFLADFNFFHYRSGTNWDDKTSKYHVNKTTLVNEFLETL